MIKINDNAPEFELRDSEGDTIKLSDFRGKNIILYFYPKDFTPGCTEEACDFNENMQEFKDSVIIGISPDSEESHKKFTEKYNLKFKLLSDKENKVSKLYEVYEKKSFMGKSYFGITRSTFIIGKNGKINQIFRKVNPKGHAKEVLEKIK